VCRRKLRKDLKIRDIYKLGRTLGTGGTSHITQKFSRDITGSPETGKT
jgi:hypothetical protein